MIKNKKKNKIWIPILILTILLVIIGACILNPTLNKIVNYTKENISIYFEKKNYGFSKKEIENKIANTELTYDSYEIYKVNGKLTIEPDNTFDNETFNSVDSFSYYGNIVYSITDDTVRAVNIDSDTFTINIVIAKPICTINVDENQINYLDDNLGLLSIRDLHLNENNLEQVKNYGQKKLLEELNSETNLNKALSKEKDLYTSIYSTILNEIEGIDMLKIDIIFEDN